MQDLDPAPVPFVVGASRSGTTLLRLMLDAHPDLTIPSETHFIGELWARQQKSPMARDQFVDFLTTFFTWPDFGIDRQALESAICGIHPFTVSDGLRLFYRLYAGNQGKSRWGDKTPDYVDIIDLVGEVLPEARFVHVVRDARAVAASMVNVHFNKLGRDFTSLARLWKSKIRRARAFSSKETYIETRYEKLVTRPEKELRRICEFIALPFQDCMLEYWRGATERLEEFRDWYGPAGNLMSPADARRKNQRLVSQPPKIERIDAWRMSLDEHEICDIEREAGDLLRGLGYDCPNRRLPRGRNEPSLESLASYQELRQFPDEEILPFVHSHTVTLRGDPFVDPSDSGCSVLCRVKNGERFIEEFIQHYTTLGVSRIVLLDNGSEDRTLKIAGRHRDVVILQNLLPYKVFSKALRRYLITRFGRNQWSLAVDIDEFFDYPFSDLLSLGDLLEYLRRSRFNAVVSQMLDMFDDRPVRSRAHDETSSVRSRFQLYSLDAVRKRDYFPRNHVSNPSIMFYQGGIRSSAFSLDDLYLTKHPLVFYTDEMTLAHEHWVKNAAVADFSSVLHHYKFLPSLPATARDAAEREHFDNESLEYKRYDEAFQADPELNVARTTNSVRRLYHSDELVLSGFLVVSDRYLDAVEKCALRPPTGGDERVRERFRKARERIDRRHQNRVFVPAGAPPGIFEKD